MSPQVIGFASTAVGATGGHMLGEGPGGVGQVCILFGNGDPALFTRVAGDINPNCDGAAVGSLYLRLDAPDSTHALYVKTALPNTWTAK
jgi:hypothetical protein